MKGLESNKTHSSSDSERKTPRLQNDSTGVALTSDESDKVVGSVYDNLTEDIIGELDNVLAINRPNLFVTSFDAKKQLRKEEEAVTSHTNNTRDEVAVLKSQTGDLDKTYENKNEEIIHKKQQVNFFLKINPFLSFEFLNRLQKNR